MGPLQILTGFLILTAALKSQAYEAHEWGTFTSLVGSNGVTQNGMYHEDEPLPGFVHGFGELRREYPNPNPLRPRCRGKGCFDGELMSQNVITQKMETPVIYFYSDHELDVSVNVRFPEGVVTDTFPGPVATSPRSGDITKIANGNTTFSVKVLGGKTDQLPYVPTGNIYGHARAVDSNVVISGAEREKFIFYRGIGRFQPRLGISANGGSVILRSTPEFAPQAAFLVHVDERGHGQLLRLSDFANHSTQIISRDTIDRLKDHGSQSNGILTGESAKSALVAQLAASGLRQDEALAMVNTWQNGYLKVAGLRLLYILPVNEVDRVLPLRMSPAPMKMVRSFVGRIEILTDTEEQRILKSVLDETDRFRIETLGRFAEPILRRVSEVYNQRENRNPAILNLLSELIRKASSVDTLTATVQ